MAGARNYDFLVSSPLLLASHLAWPMTAPRRTWVLHYEQNVLLTRDFRSSSS